MVAVPAAPFRRILGETTVITTILADVSGRIGRMLAGRLFPDALPEAERSNRERRLEDRVVELTDLLNAAERRAAQFEELRSSGIQQGFMALSARVLVARDINRLPKTCIISRGRSDGVGPGSPVVSGLRVVGRVREAWHNRSLVELVTDAGFRARARVLDSRVLGVYKGTGSETGCLALAAAGTAGSDRDDNADAAKGDTVLTSGFGGIFPPGLILGTIESLADPDYDRELDIEVAPAADLGRLEDVFVLIKKE